MARDVYVVLADNPVHRQVKHIIALLTLVIMAFDSNNTDSLASSLKELPVFHVSHF